MPTSEILKRVAHVSSIIASSVSAMDLILKHSVAINSATRNCFAVPSRRRLALTVRYHRLEAFEAWGVAACIT